MIVVDCYHVKGYLNKAMVSVHKHENRILDARVTRSCPARVTSRSSVQREVAPEYERRFAALRQNDFKTDRVRSIKESLCRHWGYVQWNWALRH